MTSFNLRRWDEVLADPELRKVEGRVETEASLFERLSAIVERFKDQAVILRGDKQADFEHIVKVLDTLLRMRVAPPATGKSATRWSRTITMGLRLVDGTYISTSRVRRISHVHLTVT